MHHFRLFWISCLVLAFALRSLIPAGFMPDFSGHGMLTVCDGVHHHMEYAPGKPHEGHDHASRCPFSIGAVFDAATPHIPAVAPITFTFLSPALYALAPLIKPDYISASPRSPPSFS